MRQIEAIKMLAALSFLLYISGCSDEPATLAQPTEISAEATGIISHKETVPIETDTRLSEPIPTASGVPLPSPQVTKSSEENELEPNVSIDQEQIPVYISHIRDLLIFGPSTDAMVIDSDNRQTQPSTEGDEVESLIEYYDNLAWIQGAVGSDFYKNFVLSSLIASRDIRNTPLWDIKSSIHDDLVIELLEMIQLDVDKPGDFHPLWQRSLLNDLGSRGPNLFLVNYDYFFSVLDEAAIQNELGNKTTDPWFMFLRDANSLSQEEILDGIFYFKGLLEEYDLPLYQQLIFEEKSKLAAILEAVLTVPIEGSTHEVFIPASLELPAERIELQNKFYGFKNDVWMKADPPDYYEEMIDQLLERQVNKLTVPLCPVRSGCEILIGKDLGTAADYQVGGLHTGVDYAPKGNEEIIAPIDMWIIQADGSSGFYAMNPRTRKPIGMGDHVVIGYMGDFVWEFSNESGDHQWNGDTYAVFGHLESNTSLLGRLSANRETLKPHQVPAEKVTAGSQIGLMGSDGYSFDKHLHFELIVSWRSKDGQQTENPNPDLDIETAGRAPGLRYIKGVDGLWYVQTGDVFEQFASGPVSLAAKYQWPFGVDIEFIKFWDVYFIAHADPDPP